MKPSDINAEIMETAPNQQVEQSRVVSYRSCYLYIGLVVKVVLQKLCTKTFSKSALLLGKSH